ncbi:extracellular solute-binding protein [Candidatus Halobonum tyrrellensis]|uniref:Family 1 extracellular solute-binding protein n=1 Tax=Candidatus Halobonum tyrrellensis G22 TaxID=1324957 RepID=V4GNU3_9EURY|nr:extracellular solute-binding protein [Candidatus Halobonum tyrrellensis]ESP87061.1 family 1 extracellular solute-binding protein [Candidatus Halobonum tyrrellensis G22]
MADKRRQSTRRDDGDREADDTGAISRRPFLKATSAGLLGGALAGCSGNGDGDGDGGGGGGGGGDGGDGGGGGGGSETTAQATVEADLSGVEFDFWERQYYDESPAAQEALETIIGNFEEQTGATVNVNFQGDEQPLIDAFNQGTYPQAMTEFAQSMGNWMQTGQIRPFAEYQDEFDYDVMNSIGALNEAVDFTFRGWDEGNTVFPITANVFAPFVGRMDLYEEAGLDPDSDFPPENFEELVEHATALQEDSSAQIGYQPVHDTVDNQDVYFNQWMAADGGAEGYFFNEDWSDLNVDSDLWHTWLQRDIDLFREHGFGTPDTPTMNDEEITPLMINGRVALSNQAPMNLPGFVERGGDMYRENFRWAPSFGLGTGVNGRALIPGGVLMLPPDGADEATWEEKQQGAIELLKYFNDPILQVQTMPSLGFMPANQNLWEEIPNEMNGFAETIKSTAENAKYGYPAHPDFGPIGYDIFGAKKQQASQGELSVDEVLEQTYDEGMELVNDSQWAA